MYSVSGEFLDAVRTSHTMVADARVVSAGSVLATLSVDDGTVNVDGRSSIRRRMDVQLVDDTGTLTPNDAADLLMPFGNEIQLRRGVALPGGNEMVSLGIFRITEASVSESPSGVVINVSGYDRAHLYERSFGRGFHIRSGTLITDAIKSMINDQFAATFHFMSSLHAAPTLIYQPRDETWAEARLLAESIGAELFFDSDGNCVLAPSPALGLGPVVQRYTEDEAEVMIEMRKTFKSDDVHNGVIVEGVNSTGAPIVATAWDEDPASPTYYKGRFGRNPLSVRLESVTTTVQAQAAATARLRKELGLSDEIQFPMVVNPALDVGDIIYVENTSALVANAYILDRLTIPLRPEAPMQGTGRRRPQQVGTI